MLLLLGFSDNFEFSKLFQKYDSVETLRLKCGLLAEWIESARHVVLHTGAGISTAAGIPDFRYVCDNCLKKTTSYSLICL